MMLVFRAYFIFTWYFLQIMSIFVQRNLNCHTALRIDEHLISESNVNSVSQVDAGLRK